AARRLDLQALSYQAEDGIRDRNVTGVQTCALPISIVLVRLVACPCAVDGAVQRALGRPHTFRSPVSRPSSVRVAAISVGLLPLKIGRASRRESGHTPEDGVNNEKRHISSLHHEATH